mgnify:CR=1 FL=1|jgi:hypothetical protein
MNKVEIKIGNTQKTVTIVSRNSRKSISENDSEMDKRKNICFIGIRITHKFRRTS